MEPLITHYLNNMDEVLSITQAVKGNEEFLYHLVEKKIGFKGLEKLRYRKHHGFHLGCVQRGKIKQGYLGYFEPPAPNDLNSQFNKFKPQLSQFFNDPLLLEIVKLIPDQSVTTLMSKIKG